MSTVLEKSVIKCNTTMQVMERVPVKEVLMGLVNKDLWALENVKGEFIHSPSITIPVPSIVVLTNYAPSQNQRAGVMNEPIMDDFPSKKTILNRDGYVCCYCGEYGDTIDHIIPKDLGGTSKWDNLVAACSECNGKKTNIPLTTLGWKMRYTPTRPLVKHMIKTRIDQNVRDQLIVNKIVEERVKA